MPESFAAEAVTELVVGVDGSPASDEALAWSVHETRRRACPLRAVMAWYPSGAPQQVEELSALTSTAELSLDPERCHRHGRCQPDSDGRGGSRRDS